MLQARGEAGCGHGQNEIDTLRHVVLNQHRDVGNFGLRMRSEHFKIASLFEALLFKAVPDALHTGVRAFFRGEIDEPNASGSVALSSRVTSRNPLASGECKSASGGLNNHGAARNVKCRHEIPPGKKWWLNVTGGQHFSDGAVELLATANIVEAAQ